MLAIWLSNTELWTCSPSWFKIPLPVKHWTSFFIWSKKAKNWNLHCYAFSASNKETRPLSTACVVLVLYPSSWLFKMCTSDTPNSFMGKVCVISIHYFTPYKIIKTVIVSTPGVFISLKWPVTRGFLIIQPYICFDVSSKCWPSP